MNPHALINPILVVLLTLCLFGSYYAWGWSIVAVAAVLLLTRPWLTDPHLGSADARGFLDRAV